MPLTTIETMIAGNTIRMRLVDDPAAETPALWIAFAAPLDKLTLASLGGTSEHPLGPPDKQYFSSIQLAALRYVRDAIGVETQRLASLSGH